MRRLARWLAVGASVVALGYVWPTLVWADNYAFLVAVQDYNVKSLKPLKFTRNDIEAFAKVLERSGFNKEHIVVMTDKSDDRRLLSEADKIRKQLGLLLAGLDDTDTLIVAFAGHGVQFQGDDRNYFCPADADLEDATRSHLVAISEIYEKLKACPARQKLLVVDACRKDPQTELSRSRDTVKLQSLTRPQKEPVPKGVVALFSCAAGQEAFEWPEYQHGIFFHHFLEGWEGKAAAGEKQVTLDQVVAYARQKTQAFARVNLEVAQTPQLKSEFAGTWVVHTLKAAETAAKPAPAVSTPAAKSSEAETALEPEFKNSIGMILRLIPAGEFTMGSPESEYSHLRSEYSRQKDETQHPVKITKAFYIGKYEVTVREFRKVMGWPPNTASRPDRHPVADVTWYHAVEFCNKLSEAEGLPAYYRLSDIEKDQYQRIKYADMTIVGGKGYRLPTEAEWEYACRAGTTSAFHFERDLENASSESNVNQSALSGGPKDVGSYNANKFGLHDMHGNVAEWCQDWYDKNYYASSPKMDPPGPTSGARRVVRGGRWFSFPTYARSARRDSDSPEQCQSWIGFRVAGGVPARTR